MKNNRYNGIIDKLLEATSEGSLSWDQTSNKNEYQAVIGEISVLIVGPRKSLGFSTNLDMESMSIALVNKDGIEIDRQKVEKSDASYNNFLSLFDRVRLQYYKVDEVLSELESKL